VTEPPAHLAKEDRVKNIGLAITAACVFFLWVGSAQAASSDAVKPLSEADRATAVALVQSSPDVIGLLTP
jgi:hypothetical protein